MSRQGQGRLCLIVPFQPSQGFYFYDGRQRKTPHFARDFHHLNPSCDQTDPQLLVLPAFPLISFLDPTAHRGPLS
jgi:hypothetical protein